MTRKIHFFTGAIVASTLIVPLVLNAQPASTLSEPALSPANMTAQWWQWAFSIPNVPASGEGGSIHPLVGGDDDFGANDVFEFCGNGQHGDLWFLGGDFSGSGEAFERTCTIPYGKTIVLPVINVECSTAEGNASVDDSVKDQSADLKECAQEFGDNFIGSASFGPADGPLEEIKVKRLATVKAFPIYFSPDNVIGLEADPNPSLAQADGLWVILRNLQPGLYRIEFNGVFIDPTVFEIVGAYNIEIAEPGGKALGE